MRILLLSDLYPPIIGGLEQHVQSLAHGLASRGHQVSVATLWQEGLAEREVSGGVTIRRIRGTFQRFGPAFGDSARRYAAPAPDPGVMAALRRIVARERPEVVHAHNWMVHSFLPLKRSAEAALVLSLHDYSLVCAKKSLLYRDDVCTGPGPLKCLRCTAGHYGPAKGPAILAGNTVMTLLEQHLVDLFVPVSTSVAEGNALAASGLPFEVIPNFVPDEVARVPLDHPIHRQLPAEYLLFVGALGRHKGVDVLLEAHQMLPTAPPLVLMGSTWPGMPSSFPPNTLILRDVPHDAVMVAMAGSLALVVPSIYADACPTVAIEAMASGRPVIATRMGGLPDLVDDGVTGFLLPARDPRALAEAMLRLSSDSALRERMGAAGRNKSLDFVVSTVIGRLEEAYARSLRGARTAA